MIGLRISTKIALLVAFFVLLIPFCIGEIIIRRTAQRGIEDTVDNEFITKIRGDKIPFVKNALKTLREDVIREGGGRINNFIVFSDMAERLVNWPALKDVDELAGDEEAQKPWSADWKKKQAELWTGALSTKDSYARISLVRLKDEKEIVCVYRKRIEKGPGTAATVVEICSDEDLGELDWTDYPPYAREELTENVGDRVVFSSIVTDGEASNHLEPPAKPVIRAAVSIAYPNLEFIEGETAWEEALSPEEREEMKRLDDWDPQKPTPFGLIVVTMDLDSVFSQLVDVSGGFSSSSGHPDAAIKKATRTIFVADVDGRLLAWTGGAPLSDLGHRGLNPAGVEPGEGAKMSLLSSPTIHALYPQLGPVLLGEGEPEVRQHRIEGKDRGSFFRAPVGPVDSNPVLGLAMVAGYDELFQEEVAEANWIRVFALMLGIFASACAVMYTRWVLRPLAKFSETTRKVADRQFQELQLPVERRDEIGNLARDFAEMSRKLEEHERNLRHQRENLQRMVAERTVELRTKNRALEEANRAKDQFLAGISHDMRTPLHPIMVYSRQLKKRGDKLGWEPKILERLENCYLRAKLLLALIDNIFDIFKIQAGKPIEIEPTNLSLPSLLDEVVKIVTVEVEKNQNQLEIEIGPGVDTIRTDKSMLERILINLLFNACKFTYRGRISLEAALNRISEREEVLITITDTGAGMDNVELGRIFQPFEQAGDREVRKKHGGAGLGLAITKSFSEILGGSIAVDSRKGAGSKFTIRLPTEVEKKQLESKPLVAISGEGSPPETMKTVLVVGEDKEIQDYLLHTLSTHGLQSVTAPQASDAPELGRRLSPDAVILNQDRAAGVLDELFKTFHEDPDLAQIPLILLGSSVRAGDGASSDFSAFLKKPFSSEKLYSALSRIESPNGADPVLVVDDDHTVRHTLSEILEERGIRVMEAENGKSALELLERSEPGLILLDLSMPEMDGFEFFATIRADSKWRKTPVLVMSGFDLTESDRLRLNGWISKTIESSPHNRDRLLEEIAELIRRHQPARPGPSSGKEDGKYSPTGYHSERPGPVS